MPASLLHRTNRVARPIALLAALAALLALAAFDGRLDPPAAHAAAELEFDASCEPDPVRVGTASLVTCTVTGTNTGDTAATDLQSVLQPSSSCSLPTPVIPPLLYSYRNGELRDVTSLELVSSLGDVGPGETFETVVTIIVEHNSTGDFGAEVVVTSGDDPDLRVVGDVCWTVTSDAEAPPTNLAVTKTLLTEPQPPQPEPFPEPPPVSPPEDGDNTLPIPTPSESETKQAEYEIAVSNVGDTTMTGLSMIDVQTGGGVLVDADPAPTGTDPLGRPLWDLGELAPGDELTVRATYGPREGTACAFSDDVAVAFATPDGGDEESYVAFADGAIPLSPCGPGLGDNDCWHYPPEGSPVVAPCDSLVCWSQPPDQEDWRAHYGCDPELDYCWSLPPGMGSAAFHPCGDEVCWLSFDGGEEAYFFQTPCDTEEYCSYTSPDGESSFQNRCEFPVCWSQSPVEGAWSLVWGCEEFAEQCWFTAPGGEDAALRACSADICWPPFEDAGFTFDVPCDVQFCEFTAPDGVTTQRGFCDFDVCWASPPGADGWQPAFGCNEVQWCWFSPPVSDAAVLGECGVELFFAVDPPEGSLVTEPQPVYSSEGDFCWPVPPEDVPFLTFPISCGAVDGVRWFFPPDDGPAWPSFGLTEACWQPLPPEVVIPPGTGIEPGDQWPSTCEEGEEPKEGVMGDSVPAVIEEGTSSPAELEEGTQEAFDPLPSDDVIDADPVQGTVEPITPRPSADVVPAEIVTSGRVEPAPPQQGGGGPDDAPADNTEHQQGDGSQNDPDAPSEPVSLQEALGFADQDAAQDTGPDVEALPDSGTGSAPAQRNASLWVLLSLLALAGVCAAIVLALQQRRT